jgi:predicted dienelactone hydrolase
MLLDGGITKRNITLEIWYPAVVGSNKSGAPLCQYDIREHLPPEQAHKIPDKDNPNPFYDNCYPGLSMDTEHGPYPLVLFVHGTAGFRTQSLHQVLHWASRGYVVASADYPGIQLYDLLNEINHPLQPNPKSDQAGDSRLLLAELTSLTDPRLASLKGRVDTNKIAAIGHSAGAEAIARLGDVARFVRKRKQQNNKNKRRTRRAIEMAHSVRHMPNQPPASTTTYYLTQTGAWQIIPT